MDRKYSREHVWEFDEGLSVPASASHNSVPAPYSVGAAVDPEEAFVASLSSCHMLWFLFFAAKAGYVVDRYRDSAIGTMGRNPDGKEAIIEVVLRPQIDFAPGTGPTPEALAALHHESHESCYIANSVRTQVRVEPQRPDTSG